MSFDGGGSWHEIAKGTYPTTTDTNPALVNFTHVNSYVIDGSNTWVDWDTLTQDVKDIVGGSQHATIIIYSDRCVGRDFTLNKQP
jgi:hypothetical protein